MSVSFLARDNARLPPLELESVKPIVLFQPVTHNVNVFITWFCELCMLYVTNKLI